MAVVAEHAGVSRGAAQHHFPTREALFTAALEHVTQSSAASSCAARSPSGAPSSTPTPSSSWSSTLFTGTFFRAALMLWVAAASEPQLREQIVPLEARIGREVHRVVVDLLGVDERRAGRARDRAGHPRPRPRARAGEPAHRRQRAADRDRRGSGPAMLDAALR